jgi:DNA-binding MarR family transcriptional regulator
MLPDSSAGERAHRLWQALSACDAARDRSLIHQLSPLGLTPPQARLLQLLATGPRGLGELATALGVTRPNVTLVVSNLARAGLLVRNADAPDRRAATARITPSGKLLAHQANTVMIELETRLAEGLTPDEQEILARLVAKLVTTVSTSAPRL